MKIHWDKLADIKEIKPFFEKDDQTFQNQILSYVEIWTKIDPQDLDKLALLRALEVTNGCTQWAFRRQDRECLSLEQTRKCMKLSMSSIKNKEIPLSNGESITFSEAMKKLIDEGRDLYIDAFKNNVEGKEQEFYALSIAQFLIYGEERMKRAFKIVEENYLDYFTPFYLNKGINYVKPYLGARE